MNRYEEEIVTAQYAEEPNDLMPPHNADSNSGGLSLGCILSIVAGVFFCLLLLAAAVGFSYFVWSSKKQNQIAIADEPTITVTSLDENSLAQHVLVNRHLVFVATVVLVFVAKPMWEFFVDSSDGLTDLSAGCLLYTSPSPRDS